MRINNRVKETYRITEVQDDKLIERNRWRDGDEH